jgi:hypothetical protein
LAFDIEVAYVLVCDALTFKYGYNRELNIVKTLFAPFPRVGAENQY